MFRGYRGWGRRRWYRPYRPFCGCGPLGCLWVMVLPALVTMWILMAACTRLTW